MCVYVHMHVVCVCARMHVVCVCRHYCNDMVLKCKPATLPGAFPRK